MEIEVLLELIELILTQKDGVEAFAEAILKRKFCFPYFDYLLSEGFLPDGAALLAATQMRQIEIVRFVLKSGVNPTLESFQYAAEHEFFELCHLFVEFGSREILSTPELEDELKTAIRLKQLQEKAITLINQGINVMATNDEDEDDNFIHQASLYGRFKIVRLLLKHGVDPTTDDNMAIKLASERGHLEVVRLLLENGADPTADNNYAIKYASRYGRTDVVRLLLNNNSKYKVDLTAGDNFAIKWTSRMGYDKIVQLLLDNGADPTAEDNYAIKWASQNDWIEVVETLLKNNSKYTVNPAAEDNYAIKHASGHYKDKIIALLEEYGARR
jgi:ankyrin repeat protein